MIPDDDPAHDGGDADLSRDENKWALALHLAATQTIVKLDQQTLEQRMQASHRSVCMFANLTE
jgi:hypothetical protein